MTKRQELQVLIEAMLKSNNSIKVQLSLECVYQRELVNGETQETTIFFRLRATDILFNVDDFLTCPFKSQYLEKV